jgi:hypothetical protein
VGVITRVKRGPWLRSRLWQTYLVLGGIGTALYALVPPFAGNGPVINTLGISGVAAVMVGIRMNRPKSPRPWWLFALGLFLFWLGDVYTYSYPRLFHADVPFPSAGDAIYLLVYPVLMAGLLLLVRRRNPERDRADLIDSLIMTLGLSLVSWIALIAPYVHDNTMSLVPKLVSIAYPIGDILLLAAAIRLAVDTGKRQPAFYLLALSNDLDLIITVAVSGILFALVVARMDAAAPGGEGDHRSGQPRYLGGRLPLDRRRRRADPQRGCRDVHREA